MEVGVFKLRIVALAILVLPFTFQVASFARGTDSSGCIADVDAAKCLYVESIAPDFSLQDQDGKTVKLSDFKDKKNVVVYFYPKDNTPICTKESCSFRDAYDVFKKMGAEVIGISSDSVESHKQFAEEHRLQFTLLSDEGGRLRKAWGVPKTGKVIPGRVTYVIDKKGVVKHIFNSQTDSTKHVDEAKAILEKLQ